MRTCPFCGATIENEARFCLHCMTSLDEKQPWQATRRLKMRWQGILAAVLVFSLTLGCVLLVPKIEPSLPTNTPSDNDTTTTHTTAIEEIAPSASVDTEEGHTTTLQESDASTANTTASSETNPPFTIIGRKTTTTSSKGDIKTTVTTSPFATTTSQTTVLTQTRSTQKTVSASSKTGKTTIATKSTTSQKTSTSTSITTTATKTATRTTPQKTPQSRTTTTSLSTTTSSTKQEYKRTDSSIILPLPPNFPQPGKRYYTRYPDNRNLPAYYNEIKDLYVELVDIVCYQNGEAIFLEYTLRTPPSKYQCHLEYMMMMHYPPNAGPYGSIYFLSPSTGIIGPSSTITESNTTFFNYDYHFYMNNPDHHFDVTDDYILTFTPIE